MWMPESLPKMLLAIISTYEYSHTTALVHAELPQEATRTQSLPNCDVNQEAE